MAVKNNKIIEINWRGFKDTVEPGGNEFTTEDLRIRLLVALKAILRLNDIPRFSEKEQQVIKP